MTHPATPAPSVTRAVASSALVAAALLVSSGARAQATASPIAPVLPHAPVHPTVEQSRNAFFSDGWRVIDPSIVEADEVEVRVRRFGERALVRGVPVVDGVPVEGADRVFLLDHGRLVRWRAGAPLEVKAPFTVSAEEAMLAAVQRVPGALFRDVTVERVSGFARKVWLAHDDGLYAAWRVRVPTLHLRDLSDVYVHGETGAVLRRVPVARFADGGVSDGGEDAGPDDVDGGPGDVDSGPGDVDSGPLPAAPRAARVFAYAPTPDGVDTGDLVDVELDALRPAFEGGYLRGDFVETYNCCKSYVCLDGSEECPLEGRRCARGDDAEPIESELALEIPTENLPIPIPIGDVLYARTVFCSELPRIESTADGWLADPVDATRDTNALAGLASEEDAFAEVQAYYSTMQFFFHLREVLADPAFCLGGLSMQCDETGAPVLGDDGEPVRPYHVTTNLLIPELDPDDLGGQLLQGRGREAGNPIVVDDYQRIDNAAFVPALSGSPIEVPEEFEELLEIFNREYDSNLYFQGVRDFAYDGDIVFHEFTHAVVHSFVPTLGSLWHDEQGAMAEPGALNEGWSDYFSASFTNDSVTGEYGGQALVEGELGLRNADNDKKCPDDITGEVHDDSQPWAGALWEIREAVVAAEGEDAVATLDQALLLAMAESEDSETFAAQAERVLTVIEETFDAALRAAAEAAFEAHGITSCERVWPLSIIGDDGEPVFTPKETLFLAGPEEAGVANLAPAPLQLRVEVPRGTSKLPLKWEQSNGGAGQFTGSGEPVVLQLLVVESDEPVRWVYEGVEQTAKAVFQDGTEVGFDALDPQTNAVVGSANANGVSSVNYTLQMAPDPCQERIFHVQLVNRVAPVRIANLRVATEQIERTSETCEGGGDTDGGPNDDPPDDCSCSSTSTSERPALFGVALLLGLAGLVTRRRRR